MFSCYHHEGFIGASSFYGEHAFAYTQPRPLDKSGPETKASPTILRNVVEKLAWEGRDATPWDPITEPPTKLKTGN